MSTMKNSGSGPMLYFKPISPICDNDFLSTPLGSPANGFFSGVHTSQINLHVADSSGLQDNLEYVSISGFKTKSLSFIPTNPAIDEPSNNIPSLNNSAISSPLNGITIFLTVPLISTNCKRINLMLSSFICSVISWIFSSLMSLIKSTPKLY